MNNREFDALVAEKVFGENILRHPAFIDGPQINPLDGSPRRSVPRYSTDIAAAWLVVEKMRGTPGDSWWLGLSQISGVRGLWDASFKFGGMAPTGARPFFSATGATAPEAVCLAALKTLGVNAP